MNLDDCTYPCPASRLRPRKDACLNTKSCDVLGFSSRCSLSWLVQTRSTPPILYKEYALKDRSSSSVLACCWSRGDVSGNRPLTNLQSESSSFQNRVRTINHTGTAKSIAFCIASSELMASHAGSAAAISALRLRRDFALPFLMYSMASRAAT